MNDSNLIKCTDLHKHYETMAGKIEVLRGIDLTIQKGEVVAIMGESGVGKSTLLHVLGTIDKPTDGELLYSDINVFNYSEKELTNFRNSTIGFVFQFHHLMADFTALENVLMPSMIGGRNLKQHYNRAVSLLENFGLKDRLHHRPGELSGGQQQRVALARSLAVDPLIVLADEPTGNLDTKTSDGIIQTLFDINSTKGTTFVIVTHNIAFAKKCHRVAEMVDGKLK